jgi:hypothetical protein
VSPLPKELSLFAAWLGYIQSAITPVMIYLLSDRVNKVVNDLFSPCVNVCRRTKSDDELRKSTYSIEVKNQT